MDINVQVSAEQFNMVNSLFRRKLTNSENIGKTETKIVELWNEDHAQDPICPN